LKFRTALFLLVLAGAAVLFMAASPPVVREGGLTAGPGPAGSRAAILFVADGDTVKVRWQGREEWVRLLRIDTPELDENGYAEARNALVALAGGREAVLEFEEPGVPVRDRFERLLAYLHVGSRNLNVEMVRSGWSPFWTKYGTGRHAEAFRRAEGEARKAGRGLWGSP